MCGCVFVCVHMCVCVSGVYIMNERMNDLYCQSTGTGPGKSKFGRAPPWCLKKKRGQGTNINNVYSLIKKDTVYISIYIYIYN